jgi:hypothetical protein
MVWLEGVTRGCAFAALLVAGAVQAEEMQRFGGAGGAPEALWAIAVGETSRAVDEVDGVAVDNEGRATLTGIFRGRLDLGTASFDAQGEGDIFVASYARDGSFRWARQIGGSGDDNAYDMTVDGAGNIYLSGWYAGTVDFGGGFVLEAQGGQEMFVAKLDAGGNTLWVRSFGGPDGDGGNEIFALPGGDIVVGGISEGDFTIDGQTFAAGGGARDSYVIRMSPAGEVLWVVPAGGPGNQRIRAISMNAAGEVFAGFQYRGGIQMGGLELGSYGDWDGAVAKLSAGGAVEWLLPVGGAGVDNVRGVAAGPDGSVYLGGQFSGPAVMIDREVPQIGGRGDDYLIRLTGEGRPLWVVSLGGPGRGLGLGPEMDADARGVIISSSVEGEAVMRRNSDTITTIDTPAFTAYLAGFTEEGDLRFLYMPSAAAAQSEILGDTVAVTPDGRYAVQALRFTGSMQAAGRTFETPSERDSAIVFFALNGG